MAAVLIPLFFNPCSQRVFEPHKIALLRSLATLTLAGWGVRLWAHWRSRVPTQVRSQGHETKTERGPFCCVCVVLAAILFLAISILASGFSIMPRVSWLGSYERMMGVLTTTSYVILFFSVVLGMRRKAQLDRLISCIILASPPIALYGILQHFYLDPLHFPNAVVHRCTSTAGNPTFLGGYLIMVIPLTLTRLVSGWHKLTGHPDTYDWLWSTVIFAVSTAALVSGVFVLVSDMSPLWAWIFIGAAVGIQIPLYARIPSRRLGTVLCIPSSRLNA